MPEGKGAVSVTVDFKDVWSAVHDVGDWYSSEATFNLVNNAFVIPRGVTSPNDLAGWDAEPTHLHASHSWTGVLSDTRIRTGVIFYFGGQHQGQGRYIGNADVYFVVDEIGSFEKFHVSASFDNVLTVGAGVAQLSGDVTVNYYEYGSLSKVLRYQLVIRGDGSGRFYPI
jgi:hypothetical protein